MPLNIDVQQILLHLFNVLLLFAGLYFILYKPVRSFMDARAKKYDDMKDEAERILADAQKTKEETERRFSSAGAEIDRLKAEARSEMNAAAEKSRQKAEQQAQEILASARASANEEKKRIVSQAQGEITSYIKETAQKLVNRAPSEAYDEFLSRAEGEKHE